MCGIAGIVRFDGGPVDPGVISAMIDRLVHRGPDDHGVWVDGPVGFGHRRLSIIDLGGSRQPMASTDGRHHIAFNGEILNYRELRGRLPYPYRTEGDTETVLAAFQAKGSECAAMLSGQFAFAIHDAGDGSLWLFRDRLGILPLYYFRDRTRLLFASEIKALLPALPQAPEIDHQGLAAYLAHRSVPAPGTLLRNIRKLEPGHRLHASAKGDLKVERWWTFPGPGGRRSVSPGEATRLVEEALRESVKRNLVADVPVGAYLSGGLDSSLIVALMTQLKGPGQVHTFSAGFGDPEQDETGHAERVSRHLGTIHHEVVLDPEDFSTLWPRLTWHRDAPVSEPADVAVFRLAEHARRHVKVVLSGEGSDELFAGYPKYRFARLSAWAGVVPHFARSRLVDAIERRLPTRLNRARIALRALGGRDEAARLEGWFAPFTASERAALLPSVERRPGAAIPASPGDPIHRMLYADCHAWLADNLLERGDRMSMAASLELRPPFLDHRLVELAFSLPSNVKVRRGTTKWVVKEVARPLLPADIVDRRKAGFPVPIAAWLRGGMRDMAHDKLLAADSFVGEVFQREMIRKLLAAHGTGGRNEAIRIWTLLSLEIWHETFRNEFLGRRSPRTGPEGNRPSGRS